jgi:hypothetical protein
MQRAGSKGRHGGLALVELVVQVLQLRRQEVPVVQHLLQRWQCRSHNARLRSRETTTSWPSREPSL